MADVSVNLLEANDTEYDFEVRVGEFHYDVTLSEKYYHELTGGKVKPEELVKKSFHFLLERESPGSILSRFDLPLINSYFPEYESSMKELYNSE